MKYELFLVNGGHITTFDSMWQFKEGEQIFFHEEKEKRNFIIIRLTHDVFHKNEHVIRLYCQEKKVY
ncbi:MULTISPECIES: hypothetical protein [Bacillus]|uniref:DUF5348 domain-containing protein n=1 Tax=Bacillus yunxiaonensis TaxID=3127665 RepID=A0ABU8G0V6_9BACI